MKHLFEFPLRIAVEADNLDIEELKRHLATKVTLSVDQGDQFVIEALAINWDDYKTIDKVEE